ncbi:hypothetical protein K0M31_001263 [Melipona bicolor]|uniref:Uncharacterized protein n=1 Tax=Melipona bicolor TaxID=60889 RepID=A0AA40GFC5_9HYME|nr:hypothetical protein K0M31_001263 [Melipona bicolor]
MALDPGKIPNLSVMPISLKLDRSIHKKLSTVHCIAQEKFMQRQSIRLKLQSFQKHQLDVISILEGQKEKVVFCFEVASRSVVLNSCLGSRLRKQCFPFRLPSAMKNKSGLVVFISVEAITTEAKTVH